MTHDPIATRYAQALFDTAKTAGEEQETLEQLLALRDLLRDYPTLRQLIWNPVVPADEKVAVCDRLLKKSWSALVRAFVHMVISLDRADHLPEIAEALQAAVDEDQGRLRVTVRSAHRLPEPVLTRLRATLERREHKTIELKADVIPELLGGLQIFLDHRVIDGSVSRQLTELRERLQNVQVH